MEYYLNDFEEDMENIYLKVILMFLEGKDLEINIFSNVSLKTRTIILSHIQLVNAPG